MAAWSMSAMWTFSGRTSVPRSPAWMVAPVSEPRVEDARRGREREGLAERGGATLAGPRGGARLSLRMGFMHCDPMRAGPAHDEASGGLASVHSPIEQHPSRVYWRNEPDDVVRAEHKIRVHTMRPRRTAQPGVKGLPINLRRSAPNPVESQRFPARRWLRIMLARNGVAACTSRIAAAVSAGRPSQGPRPVGSTTSCPRGMRSLAARATELLPSGSCSPIPSAWAWPAGSAGRVVPVNDAESQKATARRTARPMRASQTVRSRRRSGPGPWPPSNPTPGVAISRIGRTRSRSMCPHPAPQQPEDAQGARKFAVRFVPCRDPRDGEEQRSAQREERQEHESVVNREPALGGWRCELLGRCLILICPVSAVEPAQAGPP
jgi:hypothetical protein